MKKRIIFLIGWALISAVTFAFGGNVIVKIEKGIVEKTITVQLANLQNQRTQIAIQGVDGALLFSEYVKRETGYATRLNLNGMPNGDYVLFIANRSGTWAQAFSMTPEDIVLFETPAAKANANSVASLVSYDMGGKGKLITHFSTEGDLSLGVQLANLRGYSTELSIVTLGSGFVFGTTFSGQNGFARWFNLAGANDGTYFFYVKAVDATVLQFFTISDGKIGKGVIQRMEKPLETPAQVKDELSGS
ncbi:MAG: hypothetical protein R2830_06430 [Saprospiraceae bacterium]